MYFLGVVDKNQQYNHTTNETLKIASLFLPYVSMRCSILPNKLAHPPILEKNCEQASYTLVDINRVKLFMRDSAMARKRAIE